MKGMVGMQIEGKGRAVVETVVGAGLASTPLWSHLLDEIIKGAQAVTALCGALIGLAGVYNLFLRSRRRREDIRLPTPPHFPSHGRNYPEDP